MGLGSHSKNVTIREDTYRVLDRIRQDHSLATFDMVIRAALKKEYPSEAVDL